MSKPMPVLTCLLRTTSFPVLFLGIGLLAAASYTPGAAVWLMPVLVAATALLALLLERVIPYEPRWQGFEDAGLDGAYLGLTAISAQVGEAAVWGALSSLAFEWPWASAGPWPHHWPVIPQLLLAFAVGDLLPYAYHRASHESSGWLWRVHAIHHAPQRLHAQNFARFHPLNAFLTASLTLLPLALLGASPQLIFVAAVLHNVHGVLSHSNIDFRLGPLNAIFSMAELHRLHHARDPALSNGNYGATVLIWDWLFRTRRVSATRLPADAVGLWSGSATPATLGKQLAYPFAPARALQQPAQRLRWASAWRCCAQA